MLKFQYCFIVKTTPKVLCLIQKNLNKDLIYYCIEGPELTLNSGNRAGHDLVEDVVGSLQSLLRDDTGLLQQICKV